ncbi:hypothetical protein [Xenorhabdus bovienii]|uniref:hypothetical protein n=1 Tax=Xenorhabdus bovienii TaxID=40576 RepID=UPI0005713425|nr:hypothetical protein [Xenorhabdus bovienii]
MTDKHRQMADIDDVLVKATFHIDDGTDQTQRLIHIMRRNQHLHEGICPPLPPAPKVAEVKLTPVKKARNKQGKE